MRKIRKSVLVLFFIALFFSNISCGPSIVSIFRTIDRVKAGVSEKSVQVDNHTVAYLEGGAGESVVLLHGFGADKNHWTKFAKSLTPKYHVIIPDLPGFGESSKIETEKYDNMSQVKRLHSFLQKLGINKFHLAGNSMGGSISALYAVTYPDELLSLGLVAASGVTRPMDTEFVRLVKQGKNPFAVKNADDYDTLMDFLFVTKPKLPGPVKAYLAEQSVKNRPFNDKVSRDRKSDVILDNKLSGIKVKTLILWGNTDRLNDIAMAHIYNKGIKNSKLVIMKDCGHLPMVERPQEAVEHYLAFLGEL